MSPRAQTYAKHADSLGPEKEEQKLPGRIKSDSDPMEMKLSEIGDKSL